MRKHWNERKSFACVGPLVALLFPGSVSSGGTGMAAETYAKKSIELSTGVTLAYVEAGNPTGEVVLFLHGYTDTSRSFYPTMRSLAALRPDLRLVALDQRGHGEASMPPAGACRRAPRDCFRPEDFARDVVAFWDAKGIRGAHLVGHSMGSVVAQEVALEHPDRVLRLVLIATSARLRGNALVEDFLIDGLVEGPWKNEIEGRGKTFPDDAYELTPLDIDPDAEKWMAENWVVEPAADPGLLAEIVPETSRTRLGTWLGAIRALSRTDNTERLANLRVPTFVLWATQDVFFSDSPDQAELRAALGVSAARCPMRFFWKAYGRRPLPDPGAPGDDLGHNLQWAAPEAVASDLAAFLRPEGAPTRDLYFVDSENLRRILTIPGEAVIVEGPKTDCSGY